MKVENNKTTATGGEPVFSGWRLERHDLCVAKLVALREKDTNFVAALIEAGLVDPREISTRLNLLNARHAAAAERARSWIRGWL